MSKRFPGYEPSTDLRQAITRYREARAKDEKASGRTQVEEVNAARDTPGHDDAMRGIAHRIEKGADHD
ncbi:MAG: hypothetical protein P0Y65_20575 [Candidatus Devosia phytovorans]|uniref:Uncharacterized protein n=1 Tax=Candidatus Devosia phytovorans TaxID=3121372 RepID=A0AAJ6B1K4_9HYPH|nr:hypothetical protein [Devosia sp.]WEK04538.1 MAG: hypothetical protein P0Y65_20575 [Devosia sp.]